MGTYTARVRLVPRVQTESTVDIDVTLRVVDDPPVLAAAPSLLRVAARVEVPRVHERVIVVNNAGGGGNIQFSAGVLRGSRWLSVTPQGGTTQPDRLVLIRVRVDTAGLEVGGYNDAIRFTWARGVVDVPVSLFVADRGAILSVDVEGVRFATRATHGVTAERTVRILNIGDPLLPINYTAEIVQGAEWLTISGGASGTATAAAPGELRLAPGAAAAGFAPGARYALVRITAGGALNSPQYVVAVLDVAAANAPVIPDPAPAGLFFTAGGTAQPVRVWASSGTPVTFQVSTTTTDGTPWLAATPTSGSASATSPATVAVTADARGLNPGVYTGEVDFGIGGEVRSVNVTLVVAPPATAASRSKERSAGCSPSRLALTQTGTPNHFTVPAGWPATLIVRMHDNCGTVANDGSVVANFSNGDPPISLIGDQVTGTYSAAWQPGRATSQMTVSVLGTAGTFDPVRAELIGTVGPNATNPPTLAKGGTLHNLNPVVGAALAPNTVAQVFGTGLATGSVSPGVVPLLTEFSGTNFLVGPFDAPLYFVSPNQLTVQIPVELTPNRQYSVVASANGQITIPDLVDVVPVQPGMAAFGDGRIIAQHASDFTLVDAVRPAKPGEVLIIYLAGMGATNPQVRSGFPAPGIEPLARVDTTAKVLVDGAEAQIGYAGLTPFGVGLYQINFVVPPNARTGDLEVVVMQGTKSSNVTRLPVAP